MVKKIIATILISFFMIIILMPKKELYFQFEKEINKYDIVINEGHIKENLFSLSISDASIYIKGIELIKIDMIDISSFIFFTKLNIENINIDESLSNVAPKEIYNVNISHNIVDLFNLSIFSSNSIGQANGLFNIKNQNLYLDLNISNSNKNWLPKLQKNKAGVFYYEKSFKK